MVDNNEKEIWRKEWREHKEYAEERFKYSVGKANDVIRQLALTGIAVVWVFRETAADVQFKLSSGLRIAAIFFIITLVLDFAYWVVGFAVANSQLNKIKPDEATGVSGFLCVRRSETFPRRRRRPLYGRGRAARWESRCSFYPRASVKRSA